MQVKIVEKVNSREVNYTDKKTGQPKTFTVYSFASKGSWFELKGKGKESVKQGDEIWGNVETESYVHNGEEKTKFIFTMYEPIIVNMLKRLKELTDKMNKIEKDMPSRWKMPSEEISEAVKNHNPESDNKETDLPF